MKTFFLLIITAYSMTTVWEIKAHPGIGIVIDSQGTVYYTDLVNVWKITPDGMHMIAVRDVHTHELHIDDEDNLYGEHVWYEGEATDKWGHYIWCLTSDGELKKVKKDTEGFPVNNTLVRDCEGATYWAEKIEDREVLKKRTASGIEGLQTEHRFKDIRWIYVPKDRKDIFVVDHLKLKKVTPDGKPITLSDNLKEKRGSKLGVRDMHYVMGLWSDQNEDVYVAVFGARKVKKISLDGQIQTIYESERGWSPNGGLIADDGSMWIMEFSNRNKTRVKRIESSGVETLYKK